MKKINLYKDNSIMSLFNLLFAETMFTVCVIYYYNNSNFLWSIAGFIIYLSAISTILGNDAKKSKNSIVSKPFHILIKLRIPLYIISLIILFCLTIQTAISINKYDFKFLIKILEYMIFFMWGGIFPRILLSIYTINLKYKKSNKTKLNKK